MGSNLKIPKPQFSISAHLVWDLFRDGKRDVDDELLVGHPLREHSEDSFPKIYLTPNSCQKPSNDVY